jgi:hypothetical protein
VLSHAQNRLMGGNVGILVLRFYFTTRFLNPTCQFAPFDVIRLPPAPILDYSVELFCEAYVFLREATRVRANRGIAATKRRRMSATQLGIVSIIGYQPPLIRISNRNSSGLEFAVSHSKQRASYFLIATKTRVWNSGNCLASARVIKDHQGPTGSPISIFAFQFSTVGMT